MKNIGIETSMLVDYFTETGVIKKTGVMKSEWDFVIFKELMDNALDAIESWKKKNIYVNAGSGKLQIFDNGNGISADCIKSSIYDFSKYYSSNRHYITPSRGKQGNGLKTIISICYLRGYRLLWHTAEGIVEYVVDATYVEDGDISVTMSNYGETKWRGVEVIGYPDYMQRKIERYLGNYSSCNPDVNFRYRRNDGELIDILATEAAYDKSQNTAISFYDQKTYERLVRSIVDKNMTYKQFLKEYFGTRVANASMVKGKLKEIDLKNAEIWEDFEKLKSLQKTKHFTMLKKHMIGLPYSVFVEDSKQHLPYIIEYDIRKIEARRDKSNSASCRCYANNTITYDNGWSIRFDGGVYELGLRKGSYCRSMAGLLDSYSDFDFTFHFICPQFVFADAGKTAMDVTGIMEELTKSLKKSISKEKKKYVSEKSQEITSRDLMRMYVEEAFNIASSNGKYAITARQIYYKMRELSGIAEKSSTYQEFTQTIMTEWLSENPDKEHKVNFSDRGNYYIGKRQNGLGTGTVRELINSAGTEPNKFRCYGGINENIFVEPVFELEYEYDKVLYIEKTGFDAIFKAENVGERYNMIIVSGQGYGTRAAKKLLYHCQQKGMQIYCMHDLDISGVRILDSLREANEKFPFTIEAIDLGITLEDVCKYGIKPERVEKKKQEDLSGFNKEYRRFFDQGTYYQRVELNAFTTEQILEIIDDKLKDVNNLPQIDLTEAIEIDDQKLKEVAFMRILKKKYYDQLEMVSVEYDLSKYAGAMTVHEAKEQIPEIEKEIVNLYEHAIEENLTFLKGA